MSRQSLHTEITKTMFLFFRSSGDGRGNGPRPVRLQQEVELASFGSSEETSTKRLLAEMQVGVVRHLSRKPLPPHRMKGQAEETGEWEPRGKAAWPQG